MSYHIGLQVLRAKIRGFQASGNTITSRISGSEKERKNQLWNQKRQLGTHCRYHLVAYGLLRGVPYDQIERCAPNNQLDPQRVLEIVLAHNGWDPKRGTQQFDLEKVKKLLTLSAVIARPAPAREPSLKQTEARRLGLLRKAQLQQEKRA
jgi:hypothetical protein